MPRAETADPWRWVLGGLGLANLANAAWMLVAPADWYHHLPAGVPDTGPLNNHFVRDIGSAFIVLGVALLWAALRPALRVPLLALSALFYVLHALVHVTDTLAGRLPSHHWLVDLPGVYLPALLLVVLTAVAAASPRRDSDAHRSR
jgi:predicted anti-sigma-YlaC factor YlaD